MRKLFIVPPLVVLLVLGAILPAAAREPLAIGIATPNGRSVAVLDEHLATIEADVNPERTPAFWTIWSQWGDTGGTADFPTAMLNHLDGLDITGVIWWQPYDPDAAYPNGERFARHRKTFDAQKNDGYINAWAAAAREFGQAHPGRITLIRLAHEANGKFFDWRLGNWDNTAKTYRQFWQYVWQIFKNRGALPYVDFVWSPLAPDEDLYPGDKYVDYVDPLGLNWGNYKNFQWESLKSILKGRLDKIKEFTSKPAIVTELGSSPTPNSKADWITNGYAAVYNDLPKVKGLIYLDSSQPHNQFGHPDWALFSPPAAQDAYEEVASKAKFQGRW